MPQTAEQYKEELKRKSREALLKKYGGEEKFKARMRRIAKNRWKNRKK